MGGVFGAKPVSTPRLPDPVAIPEVGEEAGDIARRKRPRGRRETFITGDLVPGLGEPEKKKLLG